MAKNKQQLPKRLTLARVRRALRKKGIPIPTDPHPQSWIEVAKLAGIDTNDREDAKTRLRQLAWGITNAKAPST